MMLSDKIRKAITIVLLGISTSVWVLLLLNPGHIMSIEHCCISDSGPSAASLQMLLKMNPVSSLLIGWALMVIAMMLPKLIAPIEFIYMRSFKLYRFWYALFFVIGYLTVWMVVGTAMIAVILALHLLLPGSYIPAIGLGMIAIVWQFSPIKQRCLNEGHDHWILAAFGWPAYRDAVLFGVVHGLWCVGSGWALMMFPMLLPLGHNLAMVIVTFIMLSEHFEYPKIPVWRIDFRTRLLRIIVAQTQIKWEQMQGGNRMLLK